jgi:hypothetical protein
MLGLDTLCSCLLDAGRKQRRTITVIGEEETKVKETL